MGRTDHGVRARSVHAQRLRVGRVLAVLAGLWAGLGWVPADGVSGRLAALVSAVALVVIIVGRSQRAEGRGRAEGPARRTRLDAVSALALALVVVASAAAALTPPDVG